MNDPRTQPGYKLNRIEEKHLLLLGAILDALLALQPKGEAAPVAPAIRVQTRKAKA